MALSTVRPRRSAARSRSGQSRLDLQLYELDEHRHASAGGHPPTSSPVRGIAKDAVGADLCSQVETPALARSRPPAPKEQ
jgi:hypothetical protein